MSREDIVAVAARLLAVWLVLKVLGLVAEFVKLVAVGGEMEGLLLFASIGLMILFVAGLLWVFPVTVARKLLPVLKEPRSVEFVAPPQLATIALTLMGVWLVASSLIDVVYWIVYFVELGGGLEDFTPESKASLFATVAQVVIGLLLTFGASGLRRLLFRLRYGDTAQFPPDPSAPS